MTEPFKNAFNLALINNMASHFSKHDSHFSAERFIAIASDNLAELELKARSNQIIKAMQQTLPCELSKSSTTLLASLAPAKNTTDEVLFSQDFSEQQTQKKSGIDGWAIMPIADYIGIQALANIAEQPDNITLQTDVINTAMALFKQVTKRFSAEFGIRYLLNSYPEQTLAILTTWINDPCQHVRRLISEGSRPRLPWGMQLTKFINNPQAVINLITPLKDDNEAYVRRSVANNLNDIAKDHPSLVNEVSKQWLFNADKNRERLIRHACRTLIKNGNKQTLGLLGYTKAKLTNVELQLSSDQLLFGEAIEITLKLSSAQSSEAEKTHKAQNLLIDYVIHHQKANGKTSAKTFKWKVCLLNTGKSLQITKKHRIKKITTRVYYPGIHTVEIMINGDSVASAAFNLLIP
ncbi:MAG: DNA alkylation repair protein [Thalassotalea sp.]